MIPNNKLNWQFSFTLKGADDRIISDTSFAQTLITGRLRIPLSSQARFITHAEIGRSWISDFNQLPASQRFITGGDFSVRGYTYESLGPKDSNGKVIGGENLLVGGIEFEHRLVNNIDGSIFFDTGNAYNKNDLTLESGAGVGIGWTLPFLSVHLYRAVAITEPGRPFRYHLTVGAPI